MSKGKFADFIGERWRDLKGLGDELESQIESSTDELRAHWEELKPSLKNAEKMAAEAGEKLGHEIERATTEVFDELSEKLKALKEKL